MKEKVRPRGHTDDFLWWNPIYLHNVPQLLNFIFTWKERIARKQFCHNSSERPNVDGRGVRDSEYNLWSSIESRLYVGVNPLSKKAAAPEIDDSDSRLVLLLQQDVLWFQVTVNQIMILLKVQRL